jgi:trk system potassium uptake protein TrkA
MIGKHLLELDIRKNFGVNIVAVRRNNQIIIPSSTTPFEPEDEILLVGRNDLIEKFTQWLKQKKFMG